MVNSTRVSNELGAGHPEAARLAVRVAVTMAITQGVLVGLVIILVRNIWGYAYSNDIEVVKYVAIVMPILAGANFLDGLQTVLSGFTTFFSLHKTDIILVFLAEQSLEAQRENKYIKKQVIGIKFGGCCGVDYINYIYITGYNVIFKIESTKYSSIIFILFFFIKYNVNKISICIKNGLNSELLFQVMLEAVGGKRLEHM